MRQNKTSTGETTPSAQERLLGVGEVCEILGLSRSKIYELFGTGELKSLRIGRSVRVRQSTLTAFVAKCEQAA